MARPLEPPPHGPLPQRHPARRLLALASPGQVAVEAEHRGFEILAGVAILAIGLIVVHAIGDRLLRHSPQPELTPGNSI
ncbi:hypothetical protein AB0C91_40385 [Streptomyces sp. NPDC048674]|uniref:hypothetical protein n=1 Tax=Streptomyces sp. NPDC048674 TaxID=3155491 RepID=UPI003447DB0F